MAILPISDRFNPYAEEVAGRLKAADIRCSVDLRNEKIGKKIREAELQRIPYLLVLGEREANAGQVAIRERGGNDLGAKTVAEFIELVNGKIAQELGR